MVLLLYIVVFVTAVNHVLGLATTTIDCMGYGNPGRSTVLTCETAGTIITGIRWLRPNGGTPLVVMACYKANTLCLPSGGVTGYSVSRDSPTHQTLTIKSFNTSVDAGEWICRDGITGAGLFRCNKIVASGPDSVTLNPPPPGSVVEGDSLTVTCAAASCNPPCSYSWTLGNQQISPTSRLTLTNINRSQTGNVYTCTATNSAIPMSKAKQFTLTVYCGPDSVTLSTPSPVSVAEGDSLTAMCAASCNPPCSYSWTLRNQQISQTSRLKLTNINRSQTGSVYMCTATNSAIPKSKTKQFTLTVYYGPDKVQLKSTSPLTVKEGDDVAVSCGATNCSPSCSFMWKFKSQIKSTSSVLSLNNIQRSAAGDYTCTVRNRNTQKPLDKTITLDAQYRSSITSLTLNSQSTSVTVDELTAMTLRCDVDGNPESDIKLLNSSQTLDEVTNSKQAEYTWNEAGCLDTGHYTCEAGNSIKSAIRESVQLVVRCSPRLDHRVPFQKVFAAAVGGNVTLKISVIAKPTPTFTWYKLTDGSKHSLGSGSPSTTDVSAVGKLTLTNVQQGDIGTYQVVVSNGIKSTYLVKNLTLDVAGPPNIPSDVAAWSSDSNSISVAWIEAFNGGSEQTFIVQYREDTTLRWKNLTEVIPENGRGTIQKAVISDLQSNTRYLVRVLAYNKYGYKDFTKEQDVSTLPPGECLVPVSSNKVTGEGIAVAIGIGIVVAAAAVIVVIFILWRRGYVCASSKSELGNSEGQTNTYEGLGTREDTPCAKMELYENLKT
ncbi:synaptogenesis protein syg-2-like [Gigantopelta aegis]|uniref:synaptogenesis protein syg-2-like n=1 Tax=Gigantopelta aegis TaxID=1735272 RepID=UPI001B8894CB|nr:synaptogenesis protein syg-2-like [Gigantopelta aegis]